MHAGEAITTYAHSLTHSNPPHFSLVQERRISCEEALDHPWFREQPLPKDRALMPTFPATNDTTQQKYAAQRRAAAAAAAASKKGG